jgi:hypothetical protein
MQFVIGDIYQDAVILQCAGDWADRILAGDAELKAAEHTALREYLVQSATNEVDFRTI